MAIPLRVSRSQIYDEFSFEEQKRYFNLVEKKYLAEIDNFYYSIFLDEETCAEQINKLIEDLQLLRECFDIKSEDRMDFHGFDYFPFGYKCYNNMLSLPECYDIFICSTLPNAKTPRILIQLRSRYLWQHNPRVCLKSSYNRFKGILKAYGIEDIKVQENRVDYAHHTNAIQNPEKFFDRSKMQKHCKTRARIYNIVGNPQNNFSIDYVSVGSRSSNSVFFRIYNKSREVIEQNYKAFFIEKWRKEKLISEYDKYCLEYAFKLKSYDVGILCGQIHWYLEYGKNEKLKKKFDDIYKKNFAENINTAMLRKNVRKYIEKHISYQSINYVRRCVYNILPPVTTIVNVEFETHRDFYRPFNNSLLEIKRKKKNDPLERVNLIYGLRNAFVRHLTEYGNTISFVSDNKVKKVDFVPSMYLSFWKRLRSAKWNTSYNPELSREYERNVDIERAKRRILSDAAVLSIHKNNGPNQNDAITDFSDVFSLLNDNDIQMMFVSCDTGEIEQAQIKYGDYYTIKQRKNRQYRSIFPSTDQEED